MHDFFNIMLAPFLECLVLVGIHSYLGLHVLRRRVIFVDLSLAQIAALGTSVGILLGIYDTESHASFLLSMSFTFIGAAIFALSRFRDERVPQEAIIGLVYAITAALAVLVVEKTKGNEHLMSILHGRLLWVKWREIGEAALAYSAVGVLHYLFRDKFILISDDPKKAYELGLPVRLWDFFFYLTFGFVITFSVKVAGVLLVFVFLVAPAIIAFLFTTDWRKQLLIGWSVGAVVAMVGIWLSWTLDLPSGPTVVTFYGIVLLVVSLAHFVFHAESRSRALGQLGLGTAAAVLLLAGLVFGGRWLAGTSLAGESQERARRALAHAAVHEAPAPAAHEEAKGQAPPGGEAQGSTPGSAQQAAAPEDPVAAYAQAPTCLDRLDVLRQAHDSQGELALRLLRLFLEDGETSPFCRSQAVGLLRDWTGQDFGYREDASPAENIEALERLEDWLRGARG